MLYTNRGIHEILRYIKSLNNNVYIAVLRARSVLDAFLLQECIERCRHLLENDDARRDVVTNARSSVDQFHSCAAEREAYTRIVSQILSEKHAP